MRIITRRIISIVIICLIVVLSCVGCAEHTNAPRHFILTDYLGSDETAAEAVAIWKKAKIFDDVFINNENNIEIVATKKQAAKRISEEKSQFKDQILDFEKNSDNKVEYSRNFDSITLYAETPEWIVEFGHMLLITVMNAEMIQVLSGNSDWHIKIEIIRPSDEKVLLSQTYPDNQDISFGAYLWDETEETK